MEYLLTDRCAFGEFRFTKS